MEWARLKGTRVGPWFNHGHPRAHCTGLCEPMLTTPDHNSHLLYPVWHQKDKHFPQKTQHRMRCAFFFFQLLLQYALNILASCLHLCPVLAPQAAPWLCIPISAISSPSPHLLSCTLITTGTRIPTHPFTYWCPKTVCNSSLLPMQHPLQFLGHPAPFPTNSFGHALHHE